MRDDEEFSVPLNRRVVRQSQPSWLHLFTAVLAGVLLAGVLLLLGIRLYLHWSVKDTLRDAPAIERKR